MGVQVNRWTGCAESGGMESPEHSVETETKPDDVLKRIAVSAIDLAGLIHEGRDSDVSETIARVLDDRQAA